MAFLRQTATLINKNFKILLGRHAGNTTIWALAVPVILAALFSFIKNLLVPPALYGVGEASPIRTLPEALAAAADDGRDAVVFVNSGLSGGDIDRVINALAAEVEDAGKVVERTENEDDLQTLCKSSLRGVTRCFGAVVFHSSPDEGPGDFWNYTMRMDGALSPVNINIERNDNDAEIYVLPFQYAIDSAISALDADSDGGGPRRLPDRIAAFPVTTLTQEEYDDRVLEAYMGAIVDAFGVLFVTSIIFITYHLAGFVATERESGMSRLLDAMMPVTKRWHTQASRFLSTLLSFSIIYLPGWIIAAVIMRFGVFTNTSVGIVLVFQILSGLSMASLSIFVASFFNQAQLSANVNLIINVVVSILCQVLTRPGTGAVIVLSLIFPGCNYIYFMIFMARFEEERRPANLLETGPDGSWAVAGGIFWIFSVLHIIIYPLLGAMVESYFHGTSAKGRSVTLSASDGGAMGDEPVRLENFTKIYSPSIFSRMFSFLIKPRERVVAVDNLTLSARRGQIVALLGANGSGKSTTLDTIAGMTKLTSGSIKVDGTGGLGIAPQKNVFWEELTVEEHIEIFNKLKAPLNLATKEENRELIKSIDLEPKRKAMAKTLSGGQKRKLQLGMMLTGGSAVCCVDEVSSGIDPLSRRKIWDILLAERGNRTIIMTTHFLDEADLLADDIAILSKGVLRASGSPVKLKDTFGAGYRIHLDGMTADETPDVEGVDKSFAFDIVTYVAPTSTLAAEVIRSLEARGIVDYRFSGPTIEDVFLKLAEEIRGELVESGDERATDEKALQNLSSTAGPEGSKRGVHLLDGKPLGFFQQALVLLRKRLTVLKANWLPYLVAFAVPVVAAGLVILFVKGEEPPGCVPEGRAGGNEDEFDFSDVGMRIVAGPSDQLSGTSAMQILEPLTGLLGGGGGSDSGGDSPGIDLTALLQNVTYDDSFDSFKRSVEDNMKDLFPGGLWLGDDNSDPTLAFRGNGFLQGAMIALNMFDILLSNQTISTQYEAFEIPWAPTTGSSLQLVAYMCIALVLAPGFLALYPNMERLHLVRGLEYSNGVRPLPLWSAYALFDVAIGTVSAALMTIIWVATSDVWYHIGYVFLVMFLYSIASTLLGYVVGLFAKGQLATFGWMTGLQAITFVGYLIGYMATMTYAPVPRIDTLFLIINFTISLLAPIGSVVRALFVTLNILSTTCDGERVSDNPGDITLYGGPILYLIGQSVVYFIILTIVDSGSFGSWFRRAVAPSKKATPANAQATNDEEVARERDPLMVTNLKKSFKPLFKKTLTAVDDVTFGVRRGEVFALLGPNGAGKSTTISVIRGDIPPDRGGGDVTVEGKSVTHDLGGARSHLGVCPQFDPMDRMTVREHLDFYARVRGVSDVKYNVSAVLSAVGLRPFADRMAHTLSGGNKRKLSLGIALMGNPTVVLLDEPSSGLDAAAKRIMWNTLRQTVAGRSILLTTHSMEEADALASRIGILAKSMLAAGTIPELRGRYGNLLHVHLVHTSAPRTTRQQMDDVLERINERYPDAEIEGGTYHGQIRFSIPASSVVAVPKEGVKDAEGRSAIGRLVVELEELKGLWGIEHFSVSLTTLDRVFLRIVGEHDVKEENY
ncbi:hypothetical protein VUR80DRAFT_7634 [Thermomyces stellatus]